MPSVVDVLGGDGAVVFGLVRVSHQRLSRDAANACADKEPAQRVAGLRSVAACAAGSERRYGSKTTEPPGGGFEHAVEDGEGV